jgi:ketosteroid isomerase-like protein
VPARGTPSVNEEGDMAGELEAVANKVIEALDARDRQRLFANVDVDVQSVDEVSRQWLRGRDALETYFGQIIDRVTDVRTTLRDVTEYVWDDTGLVTCWFEQRYTLDGAQRQISAPTTIVFRRTDGQWKMALFHSVPLSNHDVSDPGVTL